LTIRPAKLRPIGGGEGITQTNHENQGSQRKSHGKHRKKTFEGKGGGKSAGKWELAADVYDNQRRGSGQGLRMSRAAGFAAGLGRA
jgi:hypothetical protein